MLTLGRLITSSIGRKVIMALGGMGLVVFVTMHMLGNVQLFCGQEVFNAYAAKLKAFPLLRKDMGCSAMFHSITRAGIVALVGVFTIGCAVFGIRSEEQPVYEVLHTGGNKEIRQYRSYLVATTRSEGDYAHASNRGFRRLFDYISGNNSAQENIAMTAPVLQEQAEAGEKIAMTAPVLQEQDAQGWTMSFVLPAKYTMETVPRPLNALVTLHEIPAAHVAALRYSWGTSAAKITRLGHELLAWLATQNHYEVMSEPRSARYDPPWTLPFFRRNEIHVDVRRHPRSGQ